MIIADNWHVGPPPTVAILSLTVIEPTTATYISAYRPDQPRPWASSLNVAPGETRANLVLAPVAPDGRVRIFNAEGHAHVLVGLHLTSRDRIRVLSDHS